MRSRKSGFTLIEILTALIVLGILSSVVIIGINGIVTNTKRKTALASARTIVNAIKNEDLINKVEDSTIKVFSVLDKTSKNKLTDLIDNDDSLEDGLISMYGSYLLQANLCINGYSINYYFDTDEVKEVDANYCDYSDKNGIIKIDDIDDKNKIVGLSYKNPEYYKLSDVEKQNLKVLPPERLNDGYIVKLKLENTLYSNDYKKNKINQISYNSEKLPSTFNLRGVNGVTSVKKSRKQ